MALKAGAMRVPFLPVMGAIRYTDIFRKRGWVGERKYGIVQNPWDGSEVVVVGAINPEVCIMHVQRADRFGNAQYWGPGTNVKWATLACQRIIVSAEEIVDHEVILASPELTVVPSFRVDAVVSEPWGGHPAELIGFYESDWSFRALFFMENNTIESAQRWVEEWIHGVRNRSEYMQHYISRFGEEPLRWMQAKATVSAPANWGSAFTRPWNEEGYSERFQMTKEQFEQMIEEKGELV
jgi:glutaconate CoA-transferase subunit A